MTERITVGLVLRTIPTTLPTIDGLNLPQVLKDVAMTKRSVSVTGMTASGECSEKKTPSTFRKGESGSVKIDPTRGRALQPGNSSSQLVAVAESVVNQRQPPDEVDGENCIEHLVIVKQRFCFMAELR